MVIQHIWGVDESIRDVVRRLAAAGYAAIAPDLYSRFGAPSGDGVSRLRTEFFARTPRELDRKQYDGDIRAAALWLTTKFPRQSKVGSLGFCMGGRIALIQAMDNADISSRASPRFYGSLGGIDPLAMQVPVAEATARATRAFRDDVARFETHSALANDIRIYNTAGHAFSSTTARVVRARSRRRCVEAHVGLFIRNTSVETMMLALWVLAAFAAGAAIGRARASARRPYRIGCPARDARRIATHR